MAFTIDRIIQPVPPHQSDDPASGISKVEVKRRITELCGLGGIIPTPDDRALWTKNATVQSRYRSATISYGSDIQSWVTSRWVRKVLGQCLDALERLTKLFRWLQLHEVVRDNLVTFKINLQHQVEAVQIPLVLITKLRFYVVQSNVSSADEHYAQNVVALRAATGDVLRLILFSNEDPSDDHKHIVNRCALATQALCVAMLSFGQAHIGQIDPFFLEHSLSHVTIRGADDISHMPVYFQLVELTCAGDMVDSKIMAFADWLEDSDRGLDLLITPKDLLDLWGPGTYIPSQSQKPEGVPSVDWLSGIAIRGGIIYKPSRNSSGMHWKAGTADNMREGVAFELEMRMKMTIGAINQDCNTKPGEANTVQ
jgi:hypothetical protein